MTSAESPRELDRRKAAGLEVTLLWYPRANRLVVEVYDEIAEQMFELDVAPECANDAFRHPYAYAPTAVLLRAAARGSAPGYRRAVCRCAIGPAPSSVASRVR